MKKYHSFLSENFQFFRGEVFNIFEQVCFRNDWSTGKTKMGASQEKGESQ